MYQSIIVNKFHFPYCMPFRHNMLDMIAKYIKYSLHSFCSLFLADMWWTDEKCKNCINRKEFACVVPFCGIENWIRSIWTVYLFIFFPFSHVVVIVHHIFFLLLSFASLYLLTCRVCKSCCFLSYSVLIIGYCVSFISCD